MSLNHKYLEEIIVLFWDEKSNFENPTTQNKIGVSLFKEVIFINSLENFKSIMEGCADPEQKYLFLIHLFHNKESKGYYEYKNSKIEQEYPALIPYLISSVPKRKIYREKNEQLQVFSYDNFHNEIGKLLKPQTKSEITGRRETLKDGIFLSHSSCDAEIVEKFRDIILQGGLSYNLDKVKFTSVEDHGIAGGIDIPENLRTFLKDDMGFFIQFISNNYIKSRVCLNEEGAAWCLLEGEKMFLPILLPQAKAKDISWIKGANKGIKMNNKDSLMNLYEDRKDFFGNSINTTHFNKKIDEFLNWYNKKIK